MNTQKLEQLLSKAGYEKRQSQADMISSIAQSLKSRKVAVIEGGTGVGKTFAYLIPALDALKKDQRLVVATATVNLQEQIVQKDLDQVRAVLDVPIRAEIAKGRGRYLCLQRAYDYQTHQQSELALFGVTESSSKDDDDAEQVRELQHLFEAGDWEGDRDQLSFSVKGRLWGKLTADVTTCSNRRCAYFQQCPYFQAKRRLVHANVIVTNHDLLLSDMALGTGVLLPPMEKSIYVIDEAHHLPEKALMHFQAKAGLQEVRTWIRSLHSQAEKWQGVLKFPVEQYHLLAKQCDQVVDQLEPVEDWLRSLRAEMGEDGALIDSVPESVQGPLNMILKSAHVVGDCLSRWYQDLMKQHDPKTLSDYDRFVAAFGALMKRNHDLLRTCELWLLEDTQPVAKWINRPMGANQDDTICHGAWIQVGHLLQDYFWNKAENGVVLCSATLRALGSFESFLFKVGLEGNASVLTGRYPSPFAYAESVLSIPKMNHFPMGRDSDDFVAEVIQKLPDLFALNDGGVLVLFTSHWMMNAAYEALPMALQKKILRQGDLGRSELLSQHRLLIDASEKSIVFGLQSFAEGVDLPGNYCRHVIITKLPFSVPSTPIEQARQSWLTQQKKNPFFDHALPEVSIRLTQAVGRLLRQVSDQGTVTILDRRLVQKRYGKQLLENLPPFKLEIA